MYVCVRAIYVDWQSFAAYVSFSPLQYGAGDITRSVSSSFHLFTISSPPPPHTHTPSPLSKFHIVPSTCIVVLYTSIFCVPLTPSLIGMVVSLSSDWLNRVRSCCKSPDNLPNPSRSLIKLPMKWDARRKIYSKAKQNTRNMLDDISTHTKHTGGSFLQTP